MKIRNFVVYTCWNNDRERAYCLLEVNEDYKVISMYGVYLDVCSQTDIFRTYAHFITNLLEIGEEGVVYTNQRFRVERFDKPHIYDFLRLKFHYAPFVFKNKDYKIAKIGAAQALLEQTSFVGSEQIGNIHQ